MRPLDIFGEDPMERFVFEESTIEAQTKAYFFERECEMANQSYCLTCGFLLDDNFNCPKCETQSAFSEEETKFEPYCEQCGQLVDSDGYCEKCKTALFSIMCEEDDNGFEEDDDEDNEDYCPECGLRLDPWGYCEDCDESD